MRTARNNRMPPTQSQLATAHRAQKLDTIESITRICPAEERRRFCRPSCHAEGGLLRPAAESCWLVLEIFDWNRLRLLEYSYRGMNVSWVHLQPSSL